MDGELNVRAAGFDANSPDDPARGIAHPLILLVTERENGRDGDAVARMDAHGIHVLDRADHDEVVGHVAHDLELELLPPDHRLLDQNLVHRAQLESTIRELAELLDVVGDTAADAAQRERRPDDQRKSQRLRQIHGFSTRPCQTAFGTSRPIDRMASLNRSRSSATLMASMEAPISWTPNLSRVPAFARSTARFKPV